MAQPWYNDGGTWRKLKGIGYNDGGTWRSLKVIWYNDGGTWRKIFTALNLLSGLVSTSLFNTSTSLTPLKSVGVSMNTDGTTTNTTGGTTSGPNWASPTGTYTGSLYSFRFRPNTSSHTTSGSVAANTWITMASSAITFTMTANSGVEDIGVLYVDVSLDGGSTVASTFYYNYDFGYVSPS